MDLLIRQQQRRVSISNDDPDQAARLARDYERIEKTWGGKTLSQWTTQLLERPVSKRLEAVEALGEIGPSASPASVQLEQCLFCAWSYDMKLRRAIFDSLRKILRVDALPLFTKCFESEDRSLRDNAAAALPFFGLAGLAVLEKAIDNVDPNVRAGVCHGLHNLSMPVRRRFFQRLLKDPWHYCRSEAMEKMASLGVKESGLELEEIHSFILSEFKSDWQRNRLAAVRVMGQLSNYSEHVFDAAYQSTDPRVRVLALRFSQNLPDERLEQLVVKMRHENLSFRKEVIRVFARLSKPDKESILEKVFWTENRVMKINIVLNLGRIGTRKALESLRRLYDSKRLRVKVQVLEAVGRLLAQSQNQLPLPYSECLAFFEKALESRRCELVRASIRALGYWRQAGSLALLERVLGHQNRSVRQTLVTTLASWESCPERTALLRRIRRDPVPTIAAQADLLMRPPL